MSRYQLHSQERRLHQCLAHRHYCQQILLGLLLQPSAGHLVDFRLMIKCPTLIWWPTVREKLNIQPFHLSQEYPWDLPWNQLGDFALASMLVLCLPGLVDWNHLLDADYPWVTRKSHCLLLCLYDGNLGAELFCKAESCMVQSLN